MKRANLVQSGEHSSIWIPSTLKNGLTLKTIREDNRFISVTLTKVLKDAGIEELTDSELMNILESPESKKLGGRRVVIAK